MPDARRSLGAHPRITLGAAICVYALSLILIDITPFLVGMYVDRLGIGLSEAGFVQTIDQAGGVIGAIAGFVLMPRFTWRRLILVAVAIATLANVATGIVDNYAALSAARFFSGFGVVLVTTISACTLARAASPDRAFGLGLALGMFLSAAAIWLLDPLRSNYGQGAAMGSGAIWLVAAGLAAFALPATLGGVDQSGASESPVTDRGQAAAARATLFALFLFGISVNVVAGFIERVGLSNGLNARGVANALALGFIFSTGGSLIPTIFGVAGGRLRWIAATTLVFVASLAALYYARSVPLYMVAFAVYASTWNMGLAYYMSMTADNDPAGHHTRIMYIVNVAAQSIGPAIGALVLTGAPMASLFMIAPLPSIVAAWLVFTASSRSRARSAPVPLV